MAKGTASIKGVGREVEGVNYPHINLSLTQYQRYNAKSNSLKSKTLGSL
jgi:hypothetical protein